VNDIRSTRNLQLLIGAGAHLLASGWRRKRSSFVLRSPDSHKGPRDLSFETVQKLQVSEPDFCDDKLRDKAYPA
jgi:hypothetical protein